MTDRALAGVLIAAFVVLVLVWQLCGPLLRRGRRARLMAQPLRPEWSAHIERNVALAAAMPAPLRARLDQLVNVFMHEKRFIGCGGLNVTDEIAVTIAAQACVLIANRGDGCFDDLSQLLVYPHAFYVDQDLVDDHGVVHERRDILLGESWDSSQVIVSWQDAREGGRFAADGVNVVIHEFAHQLDGQSGGVNGAPLLGAGDDYSVWSQTMSDAFDELQQRADSGQASVFDFYGATDPAEFFAVASETFFECPRQLRREHPGVYQRLREFYRQDPAAWLDDDGRRAK